MKRSLLLATLCAAVLIFASLTRAADSGFPIYFDNSKLLVRAETVDRTTYLPLIDIVQFMKLPYTDSLSLETFTIRSGNSRLVLTKNSGLISINDQIVLLRNPILRETDRWMVPVDFLTQGLSKITGTAFRYRLGAPRIFAGAVESPQLVMNAQSLGTITRLTIRVGTPANVSVNRSDAKRAVLTIDRNPLDPLREQVDHHDSLVHSIVYDDSDGNSKIVVDTTDEVADVRVTPAEGNEIFFIDFSRKALTTAAEPPEPAPKPDQLNVPAAKGKVRVVVLDPGHGGMDAGARNAAVTEKDLTLTLARKLRSTLQTRLGVTVLLTRDSDTEMDNESRSAVANNNQANLFISLHAGFSPNKADSESAIFVMKENFGSSVRTTSGRLFLPWYLGFRASQSASLQIAKLLQDELTKAIPGWKFPLHSAPLAVLSSTTMPSVLLEIGNLNNAVNAQTLVDPGFQNRLVNTIASGVQRFSESAGGSSF
jgi:N-acetylmuramoyl-L-alanine amidase